MVISIIDLFELLRPSELIPVPELENAVLEPLLGFELCSGRAYYPMGSAICRRPPGLWILGGPDFRNFGPFSTDPRCFDFLRPTAGFAAIFRPNGKNFVHFLSMFVPKPCFLAQIRVEQNSDIFLIFQESQILGGRIVGLRSRQILDNLTF